ncbi:MAG: SCP2 sterol-binding domain-containing protein [Actinomycetota bacterium]
MKFLSEEWANTLKDLANASEEFKRVAAKTSTKIQQVVTDAPGGDIHYWITVEAGVIDVGVGEIADAALTISEDYDTAVALAKGELSGVAAYMGGKVQISNIMKAMSLQTPLTALAPIVRAVECEY